jgi:hypothetical protein
VSYNRNKGPNNGSSSFPNANRPLCQICGKSGHQALDCFHRMDFSYQGRHPPAQLAAMTAKTNPEGYQPWFADSGANHHITDDMNNLQISEPYCGGEEVSVGNGSGLFIAHTGSSLFKHSNTDFLMKDILHCPNAAAKLLSIQKFCKDNHCWFKLTYDYFIVKDNLTGQILLQGPSREGLYPIRFPSSINKARAYAASIGVSAVSSIWHHRLGHPASHVFHLVKNNCNLPIKGSINKDPICESYQMAKSKHLAFLDANRNAMCPLEVIHSDLWCSPISSISGCRFYVVFIDEFSRFTWMFPLQFKSGVFAAFVKFKSFAENQFSSKIKNFQSDGGGEFLSNQFKQFLDSNGIMHKISCPYTSQQNGIAERKHRQLVETGLALLAYSHLPQKYWVESFTTAVYLINRLPTAVLKNKTPFQVLLNKILDYSMLRIFGCACYPLLRPYTSHKLQFRSKQCIFLGYSSNHKGYRCLDPSTNRVYLSRHVVFDELQFPARNIVPTLQQPATTTSTTERTVTQVFDLITPTLNGSKSAALDHLSPTVHTESLDSLESPYNNNSSELSSSVIDSAPPSPIPTEHVPIDYVLSSSVVSSSSASHLDSPFSISKFSAISDSALPINSAPETTSIQHQSTHPMVTRAKDGIHRPQHIPDYHTYYSTKHPLCALHTTIIPTEPTSFTQAVKFSEWQSAMQAEFDALQANHTWDLCSRPRNKNVIQNKWVYKVKQNSDGSIERFKAQLVAKGFQQQDGLDYFETFSPVIKPSTIRIILALAVHYDWPLRQLDVSNAFLHGSLAEEVFMEQPSGFINPMFPEHVCRLKKAIYGLKQAPRAWFNRLSQSLLNLGFTESLVDYSLFIYHHSNVHMFLLVYVDDIIVTGNSLSAIFQLIECLKSDFAMKDLGPLHYFLGIKVDRDSSGLYLSQTKYLLDLLHRSKMAGAKPCGTPMASGVKFSAHTGDPLPDPTEYRSVVGALQYSTLTRPEIAFVVNQLYQFMQSPTTDHWSAAKRVLRYLKGSLHRELCFGKGELKLNAFCDSDWAGSIDDRHSTTGYAIFFGPCLVSWSAKKQPVVSRSSTESEYRSMAFVTAELYWIRMLLCDLHVSLVSPPTLWCDNLGALALATNPIYHARTKHIEVDYHFTREKVVRRDIQLRFISTSIQLADLFTKGLTAARFQLLRDKLLIRDLPISLRGDVKDIIDISLSATSYDDLESKSTKSSTIHKSLTSTTLQLPFSTLPLPTFKQVTLSKDRDKAAPEG